MINEYFFSLYALYLCRSFYKQIEDQETMKLLIYNFRYMSRFHRHPTETAYLLKPFQKLSLV